MSDHEPPEPAPMDPLGETRPDADDPLASIPSRSAPVPRAFGRYTVRARIGAGGMGSVYLAVDPDLEREVAIKVLHADIAEEHRDRLFAEAKSMARVIHPHVVTVFDLGEQDGQVFVAMERVDGGTLRQWLQDHRPPWREIAAKFRDAARGLYAAHREGIVHRDFKPDNVLVGRDGRVKVTDFGLARLRDAPAGAAGESIGTGTGDVGQSQGRLSGSPSYMAPETIRGGRGSARADQFSFCVSLYECLCGVRPFQASSIVAVFAQITNGALPPRPNVRLPARLWRVIERGLEREPERRFPSMLAVAEALDAVLVPRWRRWAIPMVSAAVVGSAVAGAVWGQSGADSPCRDAAARLSGVWDPARADALDAALGAVAVPYADATREQVRGRLDAYARAWIERHTDACEATHVHEVQTPEVLALRVRCLDERRAELARTVELLEDADPAMMEHAVDMVAELPALSRCDAVDALQVEMPPPDDPEQAAELDGLREMFAGLRAQLRAQRVVDALDDLESLRARAEALGYPPLQLDAQLLWGEALQHDGRFADAERELTIAYELALAQGNVEDAAAAASGLTFVTGVQLARTDAGRAWGVTAEGLGRRVDPDGPALAHALNSVGIVHAMSGDLDGAEQRFEHGLRIWEAQPGGSNHELAPALNSIGNLRRMQGRFDEAMAAYRRSEAIATETFGAQHPLVATAIVNLAMVEHALGQPQAALASYARAQAIQERAHGPDHPSVAHSLNNAAVIYDQLGRTAEAMPLYERALAIRERALGPDHPFVGETLDNMGLSFQIAGDHARAIEFFLRALATFERIDHAGVDAVRSQCAASELALAEQRWAEGDRAGGRALADRARARVPDADAALVAELEGWLAAHPS